MCCIKSLIAVKYHNYYMQHWARVYGSTEIFNLNRLKAQFTKLSNSLH